MSCIRFVHSGRHLGGFWWVCLPVLAPRAPVILLHELLIFISCFSGTGRLGTGSQCPGRLSCSFLWVDAWGPLPSMHHPFRLQTLSSGRDSSSLDRGLWPPVTTLWEWSIVCSALVAGSSGQVVLGGRLEQLSSWPCSGAGAFSGLHALLVLWDTLGTAVTAPCPAPRQSVEVHQVDPSQVYGSLRWDWGLPRFSFLDRIFRVWT